MILNQAGDGEPPLSEEDEILQERLKLTFVKDNQMKFAELMQTVKDGDIKTAHRIAHTLKSNAGQIGKSELQKAAAETEKLLKNGENKLSDECAAALEAELTAVLDELAPLFAAANETSCHDSLNPKAGEELFGKLETMLKNKNPECYNLLDELRCLPETEKTVKLAQHIEKFEFTQAAEVLNKIMEKH
jgi:HPt (histidine-containing phosphotransfer) domain-containing protein